MNQLKNGLMVLSGAFILSLVALYNGFPLVYSDTGTYIYSGFDLFVPVDRPIMYGLLIRLFSLKFSLWIVIFMQDLMTAFILFEVVRHFFAGNARFLQIYVGLILFLTFFTGVAWYSNQLMPDFFIPLAVLAIFMLIRRKKMDFLPVVLIVAILLLALLTHFSHLLIATVLIGVLWMIRWVMKHYLADVSVRRLLMVTVVITSAWLILPAINYAVDQEFSISKGSHVFLMAHLNETGILKKFLDENCPNEAYRDCKLCMVKDSLPADVASFIWSGKVLEKTGGWIESRKEYNKIIFGTIKDPEFLVRNVFSSLTYGLVQLTRNDIGEGLSAYNPGSPPYDQVKWWFPHELNSYQNSKQNKWDGVNLKFEVLNIVQVILLVVNLFVLLFVFTGKTMLPEKEILYLLLFVMVAILVNSMVTAGLNAPYERYQSRIVWLLPMATLVMILHFGRVGKWLFMAGKMMKKQD